MFWLKFCVCHLDTGINLRNGWILYLVWHRKYLFSCPSVDETLYYYFKVLISGMIIYSLFQLSIQDPWFAEPLC